MVLIKMMFTPLRRVTTFQKSLKRFYNSQVRLTASPAVALNDVLPLIKVEGLSPGNPITLEAEMFDDKGKQVLSNAHYVAKESGEVNVLHHSSLGGSYKGIFPSGLLSTLKIADENFAYGRILKKDLEIPLQIKIKLKMGHEPLGSQKKEIQSVMLERHFVGPGVNRIPVRTGRLRGTLFLPGGDGPYPGVIDLFGATGTFMETRAALNASRGVASFAVAYFNYEDIPAEKIYDLDLDYFENAVEYLLSQPGVIPDRCGVLGNCLGGFIGNEMGKKFDKVKAVFAINFPFSSFFDFTYKGNVIHRGKLVPPEFDFNKYLKNGIFYPPKPLNDLMTDINDTYVDDLREVKDTQFFYAIGEDDVYEFILAAKKLMAQLSDSEKRYVQMKIYPKAGHAIDAPYSATVRTIYMRLWSKAHGNPGLIHHWGGEDQGDAKMQEDTWLKSYDFFNKHVRDNSKWYQEYIVNTYKKVPNVFG